MNGSYGRDLDLNLLRVFLVVADRGSVTQAAAQLYLTQPAVSAALRRLTTTIGAPLFRREGRGLVLSARGEKLAEEVRPHLQSLVDATFSGPSFDPRTSDRTFRLGLSDATEPWLLPPLLRVLAAEAPRMRVVAIPIQFRTVGDALLRRAVDVAITVADELPPSVHRQDLFKGGFVCLFDARHVRLRSSLTEDAYFGHEHVIVSYNGDLRGVVEDVLQRARKVRCSVSTFANLGAILDGSPLLATVPELVADQIRETRPHLETARLPFELPPTPLELLWPGVHDDDPAGAWLREKLVRLVAERTAERSSPPRRRGRGGRR